MVRYMKETDKNDFIKMADEFYHSNAVLHSVPLKNFAITFREIMNNSPYAKGMVFEHNGEIAGYGLISITYSNEVASLVILLEEIFVRPKYRSCGLGTEFFAFIEKEFGNKAKRLRLEVTHCNTRAQQLYHKLGFEELDYMQMVKDK